MLRRSLYVTLLLVCLPMTVSAQEEEKQQVHLSESEIVSIVSEMNSYISEVVMVQSSISKAKPGNIASLENRLLSIDSRWQNYTSLMQPEICSIESLTAMSSQYQLLFTLTMDSIASQQKILQAQATFSAALTFIQRNAAQYEGLRNNAMMYSLTPKTPKQLAEVKAQEQLLFQEMTSHYQKALEATELAVKLKARKSELEKAYISVKLQSEEIQAMEYKSLLVRIKDYVMTFAGVAIVLMFVTMIISKMSAIKAARDAAKKVADSMNKKNYPTI